MKILAVDFDQTLVTTIVFPNIIKVRIKNRLVQWYVKHKHKQGWVIILNTLRENGKGLEFAVKYCRDNNIPVDLVNENHPSLISKWGDSRKIAADRYLDDRNCGAIGWWLRRRK